MALIGGNKKTTTNITENTYLDAGDYSSATLGGGVAANDQANLSKISGSNISIVKTDAGAIDAAFGFSGEALDMSRWSLGSALDFGGESLDFGRAALDAVVDTSARESDATVKLYDRAISSMVDANRNAQSNVLSAANSALQFAVPTEQKVTKYVVVAVAVIGVALAIMFAVKK